MYTRVLYIYIYIYTCPPVTAPPRHTAALFVLTPFGAGATGRGPPVGQPDRAVQPDHQGKQYHSDSVKHVIIAVFRQMIT